MIHTEKKGGEGNDIYLFCLNIILFIYLKHDCEVSLNKFDTK